MHKYTAIKYLSTIEVLNDDLGNNKYFTISRYIHCECVYWFDGSVFGYTTYLNNKINGKKYKWFLNQTICEISNWSSDKLDGIFINWDSSGSLYYVRRYKNDRLIPL